MMNNLVPMTEMAKYYTRELRSYLEGLGAIAEKINIVEMVTPVNAAAEKQIWLERAAKGEWTSPSFRYNIDLLADVAKAADQLEELKEGTAKALATLSTEQPGKVLRELAERRRAELEATIAVAQYMLEGDNAKASAALQAIYGTPETTTHDAALRYAQCLAQGEGKDQHDNAHLKRIRRRLKEMEFDAKGIRENFIWMAEQCQFAETRPVVISETATAIDVRDKSSEGALVAIPVDRKVNGMKLVELTGHEILCHWADSEHVMHILHLLGAGALKPADEVLYEGHATLTDYRTHLFLGDKAPQQQAPFYVIAMEAARKGMSFKELAPLMYGVIRPTKPSDEAALTQTWTTCFRVFRGSTGNQRNEKARYAFTKDRAYFEGRKLAEELHEQKKDSILELSTLGLRDIKILETAVEFEDYDGDQQQKTLLLQWLVQRLLQEEVVF